MYDYVNNSSKMYLHRKVWERKTIKCKVPKCWNQQKKKEVWEISWFCSLLTLWAGIGFVLSWGRLDIIHLFNISLKLTPKLANKIYSMREVFTNISSYCFHPSEQEKKKNYKYMIMLCDWMFLYVLTCYCITC